jgi:hypothetical protein
MHPKPPVHKKKRGSLEEQITVYLVPIINAIISYQGLSDRRVAIDRQENPIPTFAGGTLKPGIFLWGKGSPAFKDVSGVPRPKTATPDEMEMSIAEDQNAANQDPPVDWRWCIIPIEVKTERSRDSKKTKPCSN